MVVIVVLVVVTVLASAGTAFASAGATSVTVVFSTTLVVLVSAGLLQAATDSRLASNLVHALKQLTSDEKARAVAVHVAILVDGLWLRHARSNDPIDSRSAVRLIEAFVDGELAET